MSDHRMDDTRKAVEAADATGLVSGEELITQAETLLPIAELHAGLPDEHAAHATIDDLHGEITSASPDSRSIEHHVGRLRSLPELEAIIANWWDDPKTQRFIDNIGRIGL